VVARVRVVVAVVAVVATGGTVLDALDVGVVPFAFPTTAGEGSETAMSESES